jgi:polyphosphate kinase 2
LPCKAAASKASRATGTAIERATSDPRDPGDFSRGTRQCDALHGSLQDSVTIAPRVGAQAGLVAENLSPRETRVVALGKPSDRDNASWYFQRYVTHLPSAQELVLFNRSWYNRAGVERVMKFCTDSEYERFMEGVLPFEHMLIGSGIQIMKYNLDIGKKEQKRRLRDRRHDPLKQWKTSPIDKVAVKHWDDYTEARDQMLARTSSPLSPWIVVRADDKHLAQLNVIRDLLMRLACPQTDRHLAVRTSALFSHTTKCTPRPDCWRNE